MKHLLVTAAGFFFSCLMMAGQGVQEEELRLSLSEARDYAVRNNLLVKTYKSDVEASRMAVWEAISSALPSVSASGSFTDNLKLATTLLPGEFLGMPGTKVPVTFGSQFNSGATMQANLLLFNMPLYIGIETSKLARKMSEQNLEKTELDTRESVSSAYYLILISEKSLEILDRNFENLNDILNSTRAMYSAGMAEATDVDQIITNVSMIENSRSSLQRNIELNYNLLRFQLGVPADTRIILTESLESITEAINVEALLSEEFDYRQNVNYKLTEFSEQMSLLSLKTQKASVLPTLAGFYNYGTNGMGDRISDLEWFQNSMTGLQISVPIFASGQRYSRIRKAQITLEKSRTAKKMVEEQLLIQEKQLRFNLVNANLQYQNQKQNVEVSQRVFSSMENKFRQGMASSLELSQANSQYLTAENNYISALMNLLQTRLALDKLLNNM